MKQPIPFVDLAAQQKQMAADIERAIAAVLAHGGFILGPEVQALEAALAQFAGVAHAVTCANGTDALILSLLAADIGPGDAVFVPAFTFAATAEAVARCGAAPVFVDVREQDFNIDPSALAKAIEACARDGALRPRAVVPVDLFGQPADYAAILTLAEGHGLSVIGDGAQSFGALYRNAAAASYGLAAATSFYPAKPLGCYGDGGAVFTNDAAMADRLRSLRNHGAGVDRYQHASIGMNSRLDTLQAAVLLVKLAHFADEIAARNRVAARYTAELGGRFATPALAADRTSVWAQYTIRVRDREALRAALAEAGIPTAVYYATPLHRQAAYANFPVGPGGAPVSERLAGEGLSLPIHAYLGHDDQDRIVAAILAQAE